MDITLTVPISAVRTRARCGSFFIIFSLSLSLSLSHSLFPPLFPRVPQVSPRVQPVTLLIPSSLRRRAKALTSWRLYRAAALKISDYP